MNNFFTLNGGNYAKFTVSSEMYDESGVILNLKLDLADWDQRSSSQIVGNLYGEDGYGLFIERSIGDIDVFTILDSGNNHLYHMNSQGGLITQKRFPLTYIHNGNITPKLNTPNISCMTTDKLLNKYYCDNANKLISVFDKNGVFLEDISISNISNNPNVVRMNTNSNGDLYILDTQSVEITDSDSNIIGYNSMVLFYNRQLAEFVIMPHMLQYEKHTDFTILFNDTIRTFFSSDGTYMLSDSEGYVYNLWGVNLYRNGVPWYFVGYNSNAIGIDTDDNIWIVYDGNRILKLTKDGVTLLDKTFHTFKSCNTVTCSETEPPVVTNKQIVGMSFKTETIDGEIQTNPWILLDDSGYAIKISGASGEVMSCFFVDSLIDSTSYPNSDSSVTHFVTSGDFTGFYAKKLYTDVEPSTTYLTAKVNTVGNGENPLLRHPVSNISSGSHYVGMRYTAYTGLLELILDGEIVNSFTFPTNNIRYSQNDYSPGGLEV
jgi:hypothetical protein